jgi:hypothetical protein
MMTWCSTRILLQHLSLRTQDDQMIAVLRPDKFSKEHLDRRGHTSHVRRVVGHASELRLLDFGQQVALVDLDVEGAFGEGLRAALEFWICGLVSMCADRQYRSNWRMGTYGFGGCCRALKS